MIGAIYNSQQSCEPSGGAIPALAPTVGSSSSSRVQSEQQHLSSSGSSSTTPATATGINTNQPLGLTLRHHNGTIYYNNNRGTLNCAQGGNSNADSSLYSPTNVNGFVGVSSEWQSYSNHVSCTGNNANLLNNRSNSANRGWMNYNNRSPGNAVRNNAAGGYANPINRNAMMNSLQDHQASLFSLNIAQLEHSLSQVHVAFQPPPDKQSRILAAKQNRFFDNDEINATKRQLLGEFKHFTFHENKRFYKHMDKILEFAVPDPLVQAFTQIEPPPLPAGTDPAQCEYAKSCSLIQMNHLRLFNRQPKEMPAKYTQAFERAIKHVTALMSLPEKLPMPTIESLLTVRFDGSKFAGLDYARQKLHKRRDAHEIALQHAKEVWQALMDGTNIQPHDARLGGKGKLIEKDMGRHGKVQDPDAKEWSKDNPNDIDSLNTSFGRLILMLSHRDLLILGALEQPLTKSYLDEQWPIYIGQSWYYAGAERFVNKMARHAIYHCFDAKKFDAAIDGWLVKRALTLLRSQYEDGLNAKYDTLWQFVYKSLLEVVICRDDGIRMQKHVGTTSGNCFNTLVQSIITMFLGYTALIYEADERQGELGINMVLAQCEIEVLGDDMVMALETPWMYLTKEALSHVVKDCFNIDWSGKKSFTTQYLMDESTPDADRFEGVQFLGMYFRHERYGDSKYSPKIVVPYRPFRESYLSLLFPKHGSLTREESWLRALGIYLNAAGNKDTQEWLEKYLDFLEMVPFTRPEVWPPSMEKWIAKDHWDIGTKPPPPKRITIQEWYRLACFPKGEDKEE